MTVARANAIERQQASRRLYQLAADYREQASGQPYWVTREYWLKHAAYFQECAATEARSARSWLERCQ